MKCTDVRAALPLLIYGEPSPQDAALRDHLDNCPECRREQHALLSIRRLLDDAPVPHVAVDIHQLHRSAAERQLRRERSWRRVALTFGSLAAVLLFAIFFRLEIRLDANQLVVRWGGFSPSGTDVPPVQTHDWRGIDPTIPPESVETELRVLSDLIHALKQEGDERDQRFVERLDRLQNHIRAMQSQGDLRWDTTEKDVAALYLLTRKGERP
jgi:hypothetical protein